VLLEIGDLAGDAHRAESCFSPDIRVGSRKESFDVGEQVSRHLDGRNVAKSAQGETDDILIRVLEITRREFQLAEGK
jgi:hypothetical protein